jgi:hypothetical protein
MLQDDDIDLSHLSSHHSRLSFISWHKGKERKGRLMSATVKQKPELGNVTWRPEKVHITPESKMK